MNLFYFVIPVIALLLVVAYVIKVFNRHARGDFSSILEDFEILEILIPREDTDAEHSSAFSAEQLFASLHGLLKEEHHLQEHFTFEMKSDEMGVKFYLVAPKIILKFVESQVYAQYPTAKIQIAQDYAITEYLENKNYKVATAAFAKEDYYPIKVFRDFEVDPLSNVMATLSEIKDNESYWVQFVVKPIPDGWQEEGREYIEFVTEGAVKSKRKGEGFISVFFGGLVR